MGKRKSEDVTGEGEREVEGDGDGEAKDITLEILSQENERKRPRLGYGETSVIPPEEEQQDQNADVMWQCPICNRDLPAEDGAFNEHVDFCLSRSTIRDFVQESAAVAEAVERKENVAVPASPGKRAKQRRKGDVVVPASPGKRGREMKGKNVGKGGVGSGGRGYFDIFIRQGQNGS